jgi:Uncharacterized protein family UPF0029
MKRDNNVNDDQTANVKDGNVVQFPIRFTLYFDPTSFVLLEMTAGYPSRGAGLRVVSFRNNSSENKARMELAVSAIREASLECLEDGVEAGLMCCSVGLNRWSEGADGAASRTLCDTTDHVMTSDEDAEGSDALIWVSGDPIVEKKSVFQAHVCLISTEAQVQSALRKLIGGSSKLQRATHNMVSMWVLRPGQRQLLAEYYSLCVLTQSIYICAKAHTVASSAFEVGVPGPRKDRESINWRGFRHLEARQRRRRGGCSWGEAGDASGRARRRWRDRRGEPLVRRSQVGTPSLRHYCQRCAGAARPQQD